MSVPPEPRIYHITHVDNLRAIVASGELVSDATMMARGGPAASIGMSSIKQRRLSLPVTCHAGDHVGDYVPFYFCPRSIMLYVIHRANHPELQYRGGQRPIIHLEADLHAVVDWATTNRRRWAFSLSNAGASYTDFRDQPSDLVQLDWRAIASTDFRSPSVKEGKQAEFLLHGTFPWGLVSRIGICAAGVASVVSAHLAGTSHRPPIEVRQDWYFEAPMAIQFEQGKGDILRADVEALVNTVNCVGVMGRGIAAQFKRSFPDNFGAYARACKRGEVEPGSMFVFETGTLTTPKFIINFPTKRHWRANSRLEDIESGLVALVDEVRAREIRSIAIPPLGCGLGGLDWADVRPRIERAFAPVKGVRVVLYAPGNAPRAKEMRPSRRVPKMTPGRAVLVGLMDRYRAGLLDPFVTLLEIHKLMYFVQEAGEHLRLRYRRAPYGPYAENLRHVLAAIEGHLISGFADGGDFPDKELELVPGAIGDAKAMLAKQKDTAARFERVSNLVEGFETPFGLELLSTVHWVLTKDETPRSDVVTAVHAWNDRKKAMNARQIQLAVARLDECGWLPEGAPAG